MKIAKRLTIRFLAFILFFTASISFVHSDDKAKVIAIDETDVSAIKNPALRDFLEKTSTRPADLSLHAELSAGLQNIANNLCCNPLNQLKA